MGAVLAEAEEIREDGRRGRSEQCGDGAVTSGSDRERSELLDEASSQPLGCDRGAGDLSREQPAATVGVVEGAALWRVGELPDELVDRRREGELVASQRDAGVAVVAGDVLNAEAGDACEWLAVEEDEEPSDARPELEVVVVQEPSDES